MGPTVLFQLTFTFIYNIFSKKFSILAKQADPKQALHVVVAKLQSFELYSMVFIEESV